MDASAPEGFPRGAGDAPPPRSGPVTSLSLLRRARDNEPDAWSRLVHLYRPLVLYWCGRGGVRGGDADDVAQEVLHAASASIGKFRREQPGDSFRGWLRGITRNCILLYFRRSRDRPLAVGGSDALLRLQEIPQPLSDLDEDPPEEVRSLYHRALELVRSEFEDRTWSAFWLTAVEGRSPVAVAPELGVTPAAVRQSKSRVLRRLKQEVGDLIT